MFSKNAVRLIIISMVTNFATLLSGVFVNIFLWKLTSDMLSIAKYNLLVFLTIALVFPFLSYISKKYSVTLVFRISIVFQILYFGGIILSGDQVAQYLYLFGIFAGIGTAASSNSVNQLTVQSTELENRSRFLSISGTLNSVSAMVSPLVAGLVISLFDEFIGYYIIFSLSMALYVVSFFLSSWFREGQPRGEFHFMKNFVACPPSMMPVNITQFIVGVRDGIFGFLINILVFDIVKTEGVFGAATALSKLIVVLAYWAGSRWIHRKNLFCHLRYSMWIMFAAPIPLFLFASQWGVAAQMALDSIAAPIVAITLNSLIFNQIEAASRQDNLEELLAVKEVWLNGGKVLGIAGFILFYPVLQMQWIFLLILVTNLCYVLSYFIFGAVKKKEKVQ